MTLIKHIRTLFSGGPYYVRINRQRISVRNTSDGIETESRAVAGLDPANKVVSVGDPLSPDAVRQVNPFDHPRVLVHDFTVAEALCRSTLRDATGAGWFRSSPVVVIHPDLELAGGLTAIEARVLREMLEGAGARKVFVHYGPPLADAAVLEITRGEGNTAF